MLWDDSISVVWWKNAWFVFAAAAEPAAATEGGAMVPHEKVETEPGTIVHMERALQKVEHDKLHHNVKAWEENAKTKIESRYSAVSLTISITTLILCHH